ncbi:MAG: efflux RND transporter periplasmic adaptor subunit [Bryobacterales bacterium]|nr:efflux RND transporter periplasmic adaptor subunit [Bryobacterales bacterium]
MRSCLAALPVFLALSGCGSSSASTVVAHAPPQSAENIHGEVSSAVLPQHREPYSIPGKVEINPNRISHLVLPVSGRVMTVLARVGDLVSQGQPLIRMESPDVDQAVSNYLQSQAAVTQAQAALDKARTDLERNRELSAQNAIPQKDVLNAEALEAQSEAGFLQAQAANEQNKRRLEILGAVPGRFGQSVSVPAPITGKVLDISITPGEYRNDLNAPVMTIADLSSVWISCEVPETAVGRVRIGEGVSIQFVAFPGRTFRARVAQIADVVDPQTRTVNVRAELPNPGGLLRPEMFCRITFAHVL